MSESLTSLPDCVLRELATALRSQRLVPPFTPVSLQRFVPTAESTAVTQVLQDWACQGMTPLHLARMLEFVLADRAHRATTTTPIELVATGPDLPGVALRDTAVVVRDLFARASRSVLVAGYAVYQGRRVFQALAQRMNELPDLQVKLFLNIARRPGVPTAAAELVRRFLHRFRKRDWPSGTRMPEIYYDPRAITLSDQPSACLHAKCIVVDGTDVFISSANFTEAAQERNIEIGLVLHTPRLASQIRSYFAALVMRQHLFCAE